MNECDILLGNDTARKPYSCYVFIFSVLVHINSMVRIFQEHINRSIIGSHVRVRQLRHTHTHIQYEIDLVDSWYFNTHVLFFC